MLPLECLKNIEQPLVFCFQPQENRSFVSGLGFVSGVRHERRAERHLCALYLLSHQMCSASADRWMHSCKHQITLHQPEASC